MIYVGVVAKLLDIDMAEVEKAIRKQFAQEGQSRQPEYGGGRSGIRLRRREPQEAGSVSASQRMDKTAGKIIIDGNAAAALGCMFAGVTVVTWYPITPSSSLVESMIDYMKEHPHRSRRQGYLCHRAGGRRTGGHRHGDWRGMGWRPFDDRDRRAWDFAHGGICRTCLLRGGSRRDLGHPARRSVHRSADAHFAGRHSFDRIPLSRRHEEHSAAALFARRSVSTWHATLSTWPSNSRRWSS